MANEVDAFLARLPADQRAALQTLRERIAAAAPEAEEGISYGVPAFRVGGRPLVSYGAAKRHCSFYVMSTAVFDAHAAELSGFRTGKGSVQFQPDRPIPAALVRRLVRARLRELRG